MSIEKRNVLVTGANGETPIHIVAQMADEGWNPVGLIRPDRVTVEINGRKKIVEGKAKGDYFQDWVASHTVRGCRPPYIMVDLTKIKTPEDADEVISKLGWEKGIPSDFIPIAAGGLEALNGALSEHIVRMRQEIKSGTFTVESLRNRSSEIRRSAANYNNIRPAFNVNFRGHVELLKALIRAGHIREDSVVALLSSDFSDQFDLTTLKSGAPSFYSTTIAWTKKAFAMWVKQMGQQYGFYVEDVVAPEIKRTSVGKYLNVCAELVSTAQPDLPKVVIPSVSMEATTTAFVSRLHQAKSSSGNYNKSYVLENGETSSSRPDWDREPLRGFM